MCVSVHVCNVCACACVSSLALGALQQPSKERNHAATHSQLDWSAHTHRYHTAATPLERVDGWVGGAFGECSSLVVLLFFTRTRGDVPFVNLLFVAALPPPCVVAGNITRSSTLAARWLWTT